MYDYAECCKVNISKKMKKQSFRNVILLHNNTSNHYKAKIRKIPLGDVAPILSERRKYFYDDGIKKIYQSTGKIFLKVLQNKGALGTKISPVYIWYTHTLQLFLEVTTVEYDGYIDPWLTYETIEVTEDFF